MAKEPTTTKVYSNNSALKVIKACIKQALPVLLRGETGTGKTTIIKHIAEQNTKQLTRINLTGQTTREDLVGKYILKDGSVLWQDGALSTALKTGHYILLDEINFALPEVLTVLQALLENNNQLDGLGNLTLVEKDGEVLRPDKECRIFATCNPSDYDGTKDFNMATLSRFIVVDVDPLDIEDEEALLIERYDTPLARALVEGAVEARELKKKGGTMLFISTRDLELCARLHIEGIAPRKALEFSILSKCQNYVDRQAISKCFKITGSLSEEKRPILEQLRELQAENEQLKTQVKNQEELTKTVTALTELIATKKPIES